MAPDRSFTQSVAFGVLHSTYTFGETFAQSFDTQNGYGFSFLDNYIDLDHFEAYIISDALQMTGLRAFVTVFMGASEQSTKHI